MKTPREIILTRHQAANPKLDELRRATVAQLADDSAREKRDSAPPVWLRIWRELILPARRTWATLAAVWLALAAFNLTHSQSQSTGMAARANLSDDMRFAYREQQRVLDELLASALPPQASPPPRQRDERPRSELRSITQG